MRLECKWQSETQKALNLHSCPLYLENWFIDRVLRRLDRFVHNTTYNMSFSLYKIEHFPSHTLLMLYITILYIRYEIMHMTYKNWFLCLVSVICRYKLLYTRTLYGTRVNSHIFWFIPHHLALVLCIVL